MACVYDPDLAEFGLAVELLSAETGTWVRLWNRCDPWEDGSLQVCVELGAGDLRAALHNVTLEIRGDSLTPFLDELAANFTGWHGVRSWESLEGDLRVDAAFHSRGHVKLTWTMRPWRASLGGWTASVTTLVEAGEQLRRLSVDIYRFLRPAE